MNMKRINSRGRTAGVRRASRREKLREYNELYQRLGGYPTIRIPGRPGWTPILPIIGGPIRRMSG